MKTCIKCNIEKSIDEFYTQRNRLHSYCKSCHKENSKISKAKKRELDPEAFKTTNRLHGRKWIYKQYGLTEAQVKSMGEIQNWRCAVCGIDIFNKPYVDHDHQTHIIRGLLCMKCNLGLGHFEDSINNLMQAMFYLIKNSIRYWYKYYVK